MVPELRCQRSEGLFAADRSSSRPPSSPLRAACSRRCSCRLVALLETHQHHLAVGLMLGAPFDLDVALLAELGPAVVSQAAWGLVAGGYEGAPIEPGGDAVLWPSSQAWRQASRRPTSLPASAEGPPGQQPLRPTGGATRLGTATGAGATGAGTGAGPAEPGAGNWSGLHHPVDLMAVGAWWPGRAALAQVPWPGSSASPARRPGGRRPRPAA